MATARKILIENVSKEQVQRLIEANYAVGRTAFYDYEYREVFLDKMNYAFIVFDSYLENWIELDLDFNKTVEEHENFYTTFQKTLARQFCSVILRRQLEIQDF